MFTVFTYIVEAFRKKNNLQRICILFFTILILSLYKLRITLKSPNIHPSYDNNNNTMMMMMTMMMTMTMMMMMMITLAVLN